MDRHIVVDQTNDSFVNLTDDPLSPSLRGSAGDVAFEDEGGEKQPLNWLAFALVVGVWCVAAFIIRTFTFFICKQKDRIAPSCGERVFDHAVSDARSSTCRDATASATVRPAPHTGIIFQSCDMDCYVKYEDCGKARSGFVKIQLKNNGADGYDIGGMCADADGYANITDGLVSYSGDGWWTQEISGEDEEKAGLRVVSRGKFDFATGKFEGSWVANTGTKGAYSKFEAKSINTTLANIPIATAVMPEKVVAMPQDAYVHPPFPSK